MKTITMPDLPITEALPRIQSSLRENPCLILQAPPGAGKTTLVPLALLDEPWIRHRKILLLEPRRLAARAAAARMSEILAEKTGTTIGFKIRLQQKISPVTRIEVITEGILTRYLQNDPVLEGVGAVIFDEFHERSLHADLGLALALDIRENLRQDLRIIVMSATLDSEAVQGIMPGAAVITSTGKSFPVQTVYTGTPEERIETRLTGLIQQILEKQQGDILVFLPGAGEIRRTHNLLADNLIVQESDRLIIRPLYSALPFADQVKAIRPDPDGGRKIVLATSIAETSLTIEGIRIVIDSGQMRVSRFDPASGMNRLETVTVTRDTADQRRGRAGRLGPGICYRLWSEGEEQRHIDRRSPEILQNDLSAFVLELALWGPDALQTLHFIDTPPAGAYRACRELLQQLDALDPGGRITDRGREMTKLPVHPRLAHMLLEKKDTPAGYTACLLAALLEEGDFLKKRGPDILLRLEILKKMTDGDTRTSGNYSLAVARRILAGAGRLAAKLGIPPGDISLSPAGELLVLAYPDRIGKRKSAGIYQLVNGKQVHLQEEAFSVTSEYVVAAHVGGNTPTVFLAAPYTYELLADQFSHKISRTIHVEYLIDRRKTAASEHLLLGRLLIKENPAPRTEHKLVVSALLKYVHDNGLQVLPWNKKSRALRQRMLFLSGIPPAGLHWPDVSDRYLLENLAAWLGPWLTGNDLAVDTFQVLSGMLTRQQQILLQKLAPEQITVPSGSRITLDYSNPAAPVLAVRLQEMFGLAETPALAGGKVTLTLHLLSPACRPVQVTRDLAGFWKNTYREVKKDLKGRYPKHFWPDDPLNAPATRHTKKMMQRYNEL